MILYVIATPIGNLEDLSFRALRCLREVDLLLCEDTRTTQKLLNRYQVKKPLLSYHQHSRLAKQEEILEQIKQGKNLALVSEAGTPGISDPGAKLINYLLKEAPDLKITPVPGPSALITALSVSGIPVDKFLFLGFPPAKKKRKKFFQEVANSKHPVVFYESPHRIIKTLKELAFVIASPPKFLPIQQAQGKNLGGRGNPEGNSNSGDSTGLLRLFVPRNDLIVCRELTKKFETIYRGSIGEIIQQIENQPAGKKIKGEFVVIVNLKSESSRK